MSIIGNLTVRLGIDTSKFESSMKKMTTSVAEGTSKVANAFRGNLENSSTQSTKRLNTEMEKLQGSMQALVVTSQRTAQAVSKALSNIVIPPGNIIPKDSFSGMGNSTALIKHISQITDYIICLKQMGLIADDVSYKIAAFARSMYSLGYSVDTIRVMVDQIVSGFQRMGNAADRANASIVRLLGSIKAIPTGTANAANAQVALPAPRTAIVPASNTAIQVTEALRLGNAYTSMGARITAAVRNAGRAVLNFRAQLLRAMTTVRGPINTASAGIISAFNRIANAENQLFKKGAGNFKDLARIVQGIILAQTFYKITSAITGAAKALAEFSSQSEQASAAFSIIFRDNDKADRFMTMVEDFAAKTPYTMQEVATNTRRLLAYGFDPSVMEPLMTTLADASAASGDPETFHRVSLALGQIHTKGKLAAQELLQLTEAGIPAFAILQEKLGLTKDQLGQIGKQKIPADVAINAILQGMQDRYGGAATVMSNTVSGMLNTIKDNALTIGREAFSPLYESFRGVTTKIRDASERMRSIVRSGGVGALMQALIPADIFPKIQLLVANIKNLWHTVGRLLEALAPLRDAGTELAINLANLVVPVLTMLAQVLTWLIQAFTQSTPRVRAFVGAVAGLMVAAWITTILLNFLTVLRGLFIVKVLAQMVIWLAQAFRILAVAMVSSPWIALIAVAAGALLYFGMTSQKVSGWIGGIGNKIASAFGTDPSKIFTPKMEDNTAIAGEFNKKLTDSKDGLDAMGDAAKEAGKKAKEAVQSFDEVFNLKDEMDDETNAGGLDELSNLDVGMPAIPDIGIPEITTPDIGEKIQTWVDQFKDTIIEKLKNTLIGAGLGAIIGAIIGGLLGGPGGALLGAKIGALGGAIVGFFWDSLSEKMKNTTKGVGVGAAIGAVIGGILGGPGGALIGAGIGALVAGIVTYFWDDLKKFFESDTGVGAGIGGSIGALIGLALAGPLGAAVGGALGAAIGALVGGFWDDMVIWFTSDTGKATTAGTAIGAGIGFLMGGPLGAALGGILGTIIGSNWKEITQWWEETKSTFNDWVTDSVEAFAFWGVATGAKFADWCLETKAGLGSWWTDTTAGFGTWWDDTTSGFGTWSDDTLALFSDWYNLSWSDIQTWWSETSAGFDTWWSDTQSSVVGWSVATLASIGNWCSKASSSLGTWWRDTGAGFDNWWAESGKGFDDWASDIYLSVTGWFGNLGDSLHNFFEDLKFWKDDADKTYYNTDRTYKERGMSGPAKLSGHAQGGVFNKEHVARFAEGNKAEAIIPLEDAGAMQPFVDAVAGGLSSAMQAAMSGMVNVNTNSEADDRQILYVGNLIADDRGLRELERRMVVIRKQEDKRRG